jgi:ATP-dependent helicase/nuclease subunit A
LALDSGRYPSLGRFVESTRAAQRGDTDGPDADTLTGTRQGVRIMTIHAAKGLEAPVVFLVDTMSDSRRGEVANVFITWDPMQDRPDRFFIAGSRAGLDALSRELDADNERRRRREDLNLLYVALTRARQFLYVSGSAPSRPRNNGWHNLLRDGLAALAGDSEVLFHSDVEPPSFARVPADERNIHAVPADPALGRPLPPSELMNEIAPSRHDLGADARHVDAPDAGGADRGIAIHRLMEMLCESAPDSEPALRGAVTAALHREVGEKEYAAWRDEAERVVRSPELRSIFDKARFTRAYAEVPLSYMRGGRVVNGVVDRIVVRDDEVVIVDFKTHRVGSADAARALANQFGGQLAWYARGAAALWPGKTIRTIIVVTSLGTAIELKCPAPDSPTASE